MIGRRLRFGAANAAPLTVAAIGHPLAGTVRVERRGRVWALQSTHATADDHIVTTTFDTPRYVNASTTTATSGP